MRYMAGYPAKIGEFEETIFPVLCVILLPSKKGNNDNLHFGASYRTRCGALAMPGHGAGRASSFLPSRRFESVARQLLHKGGEPIVAKGKYQQWLEPDGLLLLEGWARDGLTEEQIAHNMGITRGTLYDWKKSHPDISHALKKGKEVVDIEVENALLKRALGYEYTEERVEISDKDGRKVIQIAKHVAPDTTAQIFWLKNRRPDRWRDKPLPTAEGDEVTIIDDL